MQNNGTQFVPLVGITHGRYRVIRDQVEGELVADNDGLLVAGVRSGAYVARAESAGMSSEAFKAAVRAEVTNGK